MRPTSPNTTPVTSHSCPWRPSTGTTHQHTIRSNRRHSRTWRPRCYLCQWQVPPDFRPRRHRLHQMRPTPHSWVPTIEKRNQEAEAWSMKIPRRTVSSHHRTKTTREHQQGQITFISDNLFTFMVKDEASENVRISSQTSHFRC